MTLTDKNTPDGWLIEDDILIRNFEFSNFKTMMKFVNKCADLAESVDHHPNMYIHDWKKLKVELKTHTEDAITEKDLSFAKKVNQFDTN